MSSSRDTSYDSSSEVEMEEKSSSDSLSEESSSDSDTGTSTSSSSLKKQRVSPSSGTENNNKGSSSSTDESSSSSSESEGSSTSGREKIEDNETPLNSIKKFNSDDINESESDNKERRRDLTGFKTTPYNISWNKLSYSVFTRKGWWKGFLFSTLWRPSEYKRRKEEKTSILHDIIKPFRRRKINVLTNMTGSVQAGRVLAIMGPSGCGKTTFLDVLADRIDKPSIFMKLFSWILAKPILKGSVRINGEPRPSFFKRLSAYLMQDDALIGDLSVRENLFYSALLRLPLLMSPREKVRRTKEVMKALGVESVAASPVGSVYRRGVSGGQRRRVSIGVELITDPQVMFLDEPTSGLDSKSSYLIIDSLKKLCKEQNKTVICTIHQPSSQLFYLFDDIMFLTRGHIAYHGPTDKFISFMEQTQFPIPSHTNPADHILDVINYDFEGSVSGALPKSIEEDMSEEDIEEKK